MSQLHIAIAGAGIGGLTTALCLHQHGFAVHVYESTAEIRPLGVGINVMPHAAAVLHGLGLGEQLDELAIRTRCIDYRTRFGHLIQSDPRSVEAGFAYPQYSVHRGLLQALLLDTVRARLGEHVVTANRAVAGFRQSEASVTIRFADGSEASADLLVGADGLHSAVRRQLHPDDGPLCYEGTLMFRGATETDLLGDGRTMTIAGNHDLKFVTYPISEATRRQGRSLTNWVAEIRHDSPRHIQDADWSRGATIDYLSPFEAFRLPDIDPVAIMRASERVTEFPMVDRDPLPSWTDGRVTLLGDAAHPMYPIGANGASQAILDGRALADCLAEAAGPDGLMAYERQRLPLTTDVVLANRQGGPERVLDLADARVTGPDDRIEELISREELEAVSRSYRSIAGFHRPQ